MRLLSESDVRALVDPDAMIAASAEAFRLLSEGKAEIPPRTELSLPHSGLFFVMPGLVADRYLGLKLIANLPDTTAATGFKTISLVLVIDAATVAPLGAFSSDWFTDFRTAAGLAAATERLARPDATTLAVFGAGKLADPTVRLLCRVRNFERVIIVGRSRSRVERLQQALRGEPELAHIRIEIDMAADEAVAAADVIATVTSATAPVFDGARVRPGTHLNIAGAFRPEWREVDDVVAGCGFFYLDSAGACLERAGDVKIPLAAGVLAPERIRGEIGALFAGTIPGRQDDTEITVFKSLGNAVQDLHLGAALLADTAGSGIEFQLDA